MKKAAALALGAQDARPLAWALLAGEVGLALLLFLSDKLSPVLIRGLQLFLSF